MNDDHAGGVHLIVRVVRWVILLPLAVLIILFALDNRRSVNVDMPLMGITLEPPLFLLLLVVFVLGLGIGGVAAWLSAWKWRRRVRRERRAREATMKELEKYRARAGTSRAVQEKSPYLPPED